jgi:AcrR family transcriptional regulator
MAHPIGKKEESRARILASAGRGFRAQGYGGLGVDGLAKAAGVTSGAFYAHFGSKAQAFREAVRAGMADLGEGIAGFRAQGGEWLGRFIDFYLGERGHEPLEHSCALQSLTVEVARADAETRQGYAEELTAIADALGRDLPPDGDMSGWERGVALLALLSGGVSMARAVDDPELADAITEAVRKAARGMVAGAIQPLIGGVG